MPDRVLAVGRIVLYNDYDTNGDKVQWPALVCEMRSEQAAVLTVFRPRGIFWPVAVEGTKPGTWSWPEITHSTNEEVFVNDGHSNDTFH